MKLTSQQKFPEIDVNHAEAESHLTRFDNDNTPPRVLLRDCPIVALHWYGLDLNGGAS